MRVDTIQAGDFLRLSAQRFPDRDCFVFDDGSSRTFAEVNRRVNQLAGALYGRGVRKGDASGKILKRELRPGSRRADPAVRGEPNGVGVPPGTFFGTWWHIDSARP